jgi:hypothetical protein
LSVAEAVRLTVLLTVLLLVGVTRATLGGVVSEPAAWDTVMICPATVNVLARALEAVLAVTEKPTFPLPVPAVPEVIVIQVAPLEAVQLHLPPVDTVRVLEPAAEPKVTDCEETV